VHGTGGGAAASGDGDPNELAELEATIRNAQADVDTAKGRLAKETSEHHKRVHQQRLDEATQVLNQAKTRKDYLRQVNLDPQVKLLEVNRKGVALKRELAALEGKVRKGADDLAEAKQHLYDTAKNYRETQAAVETNRLQFVQLSQQQAPQIAGEQLQAVHAEVVARVQEVAKTTDPHQLAAIQQLAPAMANLNKMVGDIHAALAQVAAMGAATAAAQPAAPATAEPSPPQLPPTLGQ